MIEEDPVTHNPYIHRGYGIGGSPVLEGSVGLPVHLVDDPERLIVNIVHMLPTAVMLLRIFRQRCCLVAL